jgi:hypothetical protein
MRADMSKNCGFSPCLLGQKEWRGVSKSEYHRNISIGGPKHGGDTGYWHMSNLKKL